MARRKRPDLAIQVANSEWPKWQSVMAADPVPPSELEGQARSAALTGPVQAADLVGMQKYDFEESRPVLERASARETAARVALGRVASAFLQAFGVSLLSHVVELGTARAPARVIPTAADLAAIDDDPVRCFDQGGERRDGRGGGAGSAGRRHARGCC